MGFGCFNQQQILMASHSAPPLSFLVVCQWYATALNHRLLLQHQQPWIAYNAIYLCSWFVISLLLKYILSFVMMGYFDFATFVVGLFLYVDFWVFLM